MIDPMNDIYVARALAFAVVPITLLMLGCVYGGMIYGRKVQTAVHQRHAGFTALSIVISIALAAFKAPAPLTIASLFVGLFAMLAYTASLIADRPRDARDIRNRHPEMLILPPAQYRLGAGGRGLRRK